MKDSRRTCLLLKAGIGAGLMAGAELLAGRSGVADAMAAMSRTEFLSLHATLFFATVWIVSSLRIDRLESPWRVSSGSGAVRGASGGLPCGGPKARAGTEGLGGAGASVWFHPVVDNFRG